ADCGGTDGVSTWVGPFSFSTLPTCPEPTSLTATNITSTSADLGWTIVGVETLWNVEIVDVTAGGTVTGTATDVGVSNSFSVSGLTPNNDYEFYVQADCGGGDTSAWVGPFSFSTLCNPITSYPWSEDFESVSTPDLPTCWSYINNNGDTDNWRTYTTYGVGGSIAAGLYTDFNSGNNDDYLVLPQFTLTGNERLKFSVRARSSSEPNDYRVVLSTLGSTPTDFTEELLPLTQVSSTTQTEIPPIDLSGYTGDVFIAIHVPSGGLDGYYIYFDEFVVEPIPSCAEPSALTASNITSTTADLSWTAGGTETSWNVEIVDVTAGGTVTGTATDVGVSNPFFVSGLTPNNDYEFYVQADCGGTDGVSTWVGPFAFHTLCNTYAIPFTEGFNSDSTTQDCWTVLNENGDGDTWNLDYTSNPFEGDESAIIYTDFNSGSNDDWLISPGITLTGNERLRFQYRVESSGEPNDFELLLSTTGTAPADFTTTLVTNTSYSNTTYEEQVIDLSAYTGDVYVAWHVPSGGLDGWRLYIDEVIFETLPSCVEPSNLDILNLTSTSVDLVWSAGGSESLWNVEIVDVTAGGTVTGTATDVGVSNPFSVSGLAPNNDYEFYVQADCGGTDGVSTWVGPFSFYTGYCIPSGTSTSTYIDTFSTVNGDTNISNLNSGLSTDNYADYYDTQSISIVPNGTFDFNVEIVSGTVGCAIWIDWNNDLIFDTSEVMFSTTSYGSGPFTDSIVIPAATPDGDYRMRVMIDWNDSNPGDDSACGFGSGRGEVEDYKLTIDSSLSTEDFDKEAAFTYYPNPVNNNLNLSSQKEINNVSVYNMVGQEVYRSTPNTMTDVVDMSGLQAGAYFVKVTVGNATKTVKVIKN
ncbi:MAG: choice-of-anchor J domain-containing protein, partial [Flavobacteriaceae bacterium]|nr:choice-of-anchor J domain-containing protein [Flavobacteriaceae bacterium]